VADRVGEDEESERRAAAAERLEGGAHRGYVEGVVADRAEDQQHFAREDDLDAGVDRLVQPDLGGSGGVADLAAARSVDLRQGAGEDDDRGDDHGADGRRDQGEGERGVAGQQADRLQRTEEDEGAAADRAGDQEEDRGAADREGGRDAGADQDHGAEREPAAAAGREEDVRGLLDHADVESLAPAESTIEGAAQGDDETQHREQLHEEADDDPARLGVGEAVADRAEEGNPDDGGGHHHGEAGGDRAVDEDGVTVGRLLARLLDLLVRAAALAGRSIYELQHA
jgi:hypothetical protein